MIFTSNMPLYLKYDYNFCYISATDNKYKGTLNRLLGMYLILLELNLIKLSYASPFFIFSQYYYI